MSFDPPRHPDYSRYLNRNQRVFLIDMSDQRNRDQYESMTGYVVNSRGNQMELQLAYPADVGTADSHHPTVFKLTTETFGVGLQMLVELKRVTPEGNLQLQLQGHLEIFQRRQTPRVDVAIRLAHLRNDDSLSAYRKEFKRVSDLLKGDGMPANLKLQQVEVNISAGGLRLTDIRQELPPKLSLFLIDLEDGLSPLVAIAETAWNRIDGGTRLCGYRFIHILKRDQERIKRFVGMVQKQQGQPVTAQKTNWELLDKMTYQS